MKQAKADAEMGNIATYHMLCSCIGIKRDRLNLKHIEEWNFCWGCILHGAQQRKNARHMDIISSGLPSNET